MHSCEVTRQANHRGPTWPASKPAARGRPTAQLENKTPTMTAVVLHEHAVHNTYSRHSRIFQKRTTTFPNEISQPHKYVPPPWRPRVSVRETGNPGSKRIGNVATAWHGRFH